jgi:outer membrane protein assembly factor BamA
MPVRRITLAGRVLHYGRYGGGAENEALTPLYLGYPGLVRGYDLDSVINDCVAAGTSSCPLIDRIAGSRLLLANLELRFPLFGLFGGSRYYGPFPIEAGVFYDAGAAWSRGASPKLFGTDRTTITSVGATLRVNLFGYAVVEANYVKALDRPNKPTRWEFSFMPGF